MKLIILRGLLGSGKTELANKLAADLGAEVLHIDNFKTQIRKDFPGQYSWTEIKAKAYDSALEYLAKAETNEVPVLVCEELLQDKAFVRRLIDFCQEKGVETSWFRVERSLEKLLELEQTPERAKRPVHNSKEDFENLDREIREIVIPDEKIIDNNGSLSEALLEIENLLGGENLSRELSIETQKIR
ncbi:MAG: AAA family ATPase [Candidatus Paceibacterota bacterium]|jgi:predicted kinase